MPHSIILTTRGEKVLVDNDVSDYLVNKSVFLSAGYPALRFRGDKSCKYLHRVVMDAPKGMDVDHINGNKMDCRRINLRMATRQQNLRNMAPKSKTTRFKGIETTKRTAKHKNPWAVRIRINGKRVYIGAFPDEITAARAYNEAAKKYYGEFAWLNPV